GSPDLFQIAFDIPYKPLLDAGVQFYACLGNHDEETSDGRYEVQDKKRFHMAEPGYYSFNSKEDVSGNPLVTFIAINSNKLLNTNEDPDQIAWLSKTVADSKAIWKIVFFHHPIYTPPGGHEPEMKLRAGVEKILTAGGVQLVLNGHNHNYARM